MLSPRLCENDNIFMNADAFTFTLELFVQHGAANVATFTGGSGDAKTGGN